MAGVFTQNKLLKSGQEIMDKYGFSRPAFEKFLGMGLPARLIDGKWYAHVDNIDDFFRDLTRVSTCGKIKEKAEDGIGERAKR